MGKIKAKRIGQGPRRLMIGYAGDLCFQSGAPIGRIIDDSVARDIVRVVNAHAALIEALESALEACVIESETRGDADATYQRPMEPVIEEIGHALALARGRAET